MLYILPPPRAPNPPSPWDSILCSSGVGAEPSTNTQKPPWDASKNVKRHPPRVRLRNLKLTKVADGSSGVIGDEVGAGRNSKSLSECYFAGKGTALVLPAEAQKSSRQTEAHGSNIQKHLQSMFYLLRPEETLKMAVKLESVHSSRTRYLVVVSRMGKRAEESCLLGIDCNEKTTVGLVLRVLADTAITLDGDGGFSVSVCGRHHIFKPVSVQAMWSALQTLHKASSKAREQNYFQGGLSHDWVDYYEQKIESDRSCLNEWHAMDDLESKRPPSPDSVRTKPTEREEAEKVIRSTLKEIMMSVDLDEVTSKCIRIKLEEELDMNLAEYKSFIDQEMLTILGQMDAPTEIFDHVYLGSEWNASNYEELQRNGVRHILNVTREIDNFFPGTFDYLNIRVYDDEKTDLLKHWDNTYKYITKARKEGSKVLVHCKMGISRSASVVIAYAMKAYNWDFKTAMRHVKDKRSCIKPNTSFVTQLETYQGILDAMKNKEKLQRSKSETNLKSPGEKGERSLPPGSQPTPLLQALSRSAVLQTTMSGQDLRQLGTRPKSWSPEISQDAEVLSTSVTPFRSLENLNRKSLSKESLGSLRRHKSVTKLHRNVLLPCDNGESYSVSPNQIRHLPGQLPCDIEAVAATVKQMVNEFELQSETGSSKECRKKLVLNLTPNADESPPTSPSNSSSNHPLDDVLPTSKLTPPTLRAVLVKKEIWDPGEQKSIAYSNDSTNNACDFNCSVNSEQCEPEQTMWTASTVLQPVEACAAPYNDSVNEVPDTYQTKLCKDGDPFSNQLDRVFDREERKQQRNSVIPLLPPNIIEGAADDSPRDCPSRQSSWGSYDSAVVLGYQSETRDAPSRHSSLGSGDTRTLPSRNSSWGSYDMRPGGPVYYMNEKGEKTLHVDTAGNCDETPWYPGTVRRSKRRLEEGKSPSLETLQCEFPDRENVVEAFNLALIENLPEKETVSSAISSEINIVKPKENSLNVYNCTRLSASAPERSSIDIIPQEGGSLSRSTSNVSQMSNLNVISTAQCSSVKKHKHFMESLKDSKVLKEELPPEPDHNISGIVRSLKKEFEAKTVTNVERMNQTNVEIAQDDSSKPKSLPSSPHSVHIEKDKCDLSPTNSDPGEDLSFKMLIGKFEDCTKGKESQVNLRPKVFTPNNHRTSRFSCIEVSNDTSSRAPLISSFNISKSFSEKSGNHSKRPPIAPIKNPTPNVVVATVIAKASLKQQQFGKSHPLAKINIKPRRNPLYNTM
ncbi:hypothetical protein PPYR_11604 [Photinus pyralis]|uniref:protein-serine/threonine phosphatase n=2 Tax=Photinus pyralis TaxID=7054 RepID=A0A1Y1KCM4_PHOPY|nr:uncharacterized protein LOC116177475 isoform X1 [Photinus pyralis]XP_031352320.1 uncharacterized protein LOC116177475 isoform X1 [Photinus pyralis]KAB0794765.1 hypothetical protein PPYR_11604 [Photinus pyralis]